MPSNEYRHRYTFFLEFLLCSRCWHQRYFSVFFIFFFSQGYDIEAVLGKQLDAMTCYIIERSQQHGVISFCLEEIKICWRTETSNFGLEPCVGFVHQILSTILQHKDDKKPVRFIDKSDSEIFPFNNIVLLQKVLISVLVAWAAIKTNGKLYLLKMVKQRHEYMIRACGPKSWTAWWDDQRVGRFSARSGELKNNKVISNKE